MATDVQDWTQSVQVTGGSVAITGTATVQITGTPTVQFAAGQSVSISGTPSVTIASGTVTISGTASINIVAQAITVGVNLPWTAQGTISVPNGGLAQTLRTTVVPVGTQTIGIAIEQAGAVLSSLIVTGVQSGTRYEQGVAGSNTAVGWITIPVNGQLDSQYDISWSNTISTVYPFTVAAFASALAMGYPALGANPAGQSVPVAIATDQAASGSGQKLMASSLPVVVASDQTRLITRPAIYDQQLTSAPAAGSQATVTLAASPGNRFVASQLDASLVQTAATAAALLAQLSDGAAVIHNAALGVGTTVGDSRTYNSTRSAFRGAAVNTAMTYAFNAAAVGVAETVSLGVYVTNAAGI